MTEILKALKEIQATSAHIDPWTFGISLLASLAASLVAAWLYTVFYESRGTGSRVHRAFPLLGVSITTMFIAVQVSLPLSLGLLGALSIIRFRTPIKEPEEVGFIMLVIAASIVCATFHFSFLVTLYVIAAATLLLLRGGRALKRRTRDGMIILAVDNTGPDQLAAIHKCIEGRTRSCCLESSSGRKGTASLQFSFRGLKTNVVELQSELEACGPISSVNVFLTRAGVTS